MLTSPRLRPGLSLGPDETGHLFVFDSYRITGPPVAVAPQEVVVLQRFTGQLTVDELAASTNVSIARIRELAVELDRSCYLDNDAFRNYVTGPVRQPSCIGVYPEDARGIHATVEKLLTAPGGAGLKATPKIAETPLRAVLLPHMDYARGNVTYGHGFRVLVDHTDADLFVVLATSHYSPEPFSLSYQHYLTPLGIVETDLRFAQRLAELFGDSLFNDPFAHFPEHSIELELVPLQVLRAGRPFRIVPILVGSMNEYAASGQEPGPEDAPLRMIRALQQVEQESGQKVVYLISGDLAHIGPKFNDQEPVSSSQVKWNQQQDEELLKTFATADASAYFQKVAREKNRRRLCGFAPTYVALKAAGVRTGKVLHYQQYVEPEGHESVSFASAAFFE